MSLGISQEVTSLKSVAKAKIDRCNMKQNARADGSYELGDFHR